MYIFCWRDVGMVHPGQFVLFVKMPHLMKYVVVEREATMVLIRE